MKVMIFSVTAGEGHNATARVLAKALKERGHEVEVLDTFRESNRLFYLTYDKGYLLAASRLKFFYGYFYYRCEGRKSNSYKPSLARRGYRRVAKKLNTKIQAFSPDVIVTTHPIGSAVLDVAKETCGISAKMIGICTDFTLHPYWEDALRFDKLVIPAEALTEDAKKKGFKQEQILPAGIPISPLFAQKNGKKAAREALGIPEDLPVFLVMSGSMGHGHIEKTLTSLSALSESFGIITVCGRNEKAYRLVERAKCEKLLLNLGFTDKISLLMDAADCMITKPGGLTSSEALAKGLPIISYEPIPGQEVRNEQFLVSAGAAIEAKGAKGLTAAVRRFLFSKELRQELRANAERLSKPHSTEALCAEIEKTHSQNVE